MANERDPYGPWRSISAPVPAGLSGAEAAAVEAGLDASPGALAPASRVLPPGDRLRRWCAVRHQDEAGEVSVLVMARDAADEAAPTYVVHREGTLLRLDVCRGDAYTRLGAYAAVAPLTRALAAALAGARAEG